MFDELDKYKSNGHFFFNAGIDLGSVCNAPKDGIGVYLVYALKDGYIELVYMVLRERFSRTVEKN